MFFIAISIYAIWKDQLLESDFFISVKVALILIWVTSSLVSSIFLIFCKNHIDLYLRPYPKFKSQDNKSKISVEKFRKTGKNSKLIKLGGSQNLKTHPNTNTLSLVTQKEFTPPYFPSERLIYPRNFLHVR